MKAPTTRLVPFLQEETTRQRQAYAQKTLEEGTLRQVMVEAARRGEEAIRIHLDMDIRGTPTAANLQEWATSEGLYLSWEARIATRPDGREDIIHEPELRWIETRLT